MRRILVDNARSKRAIKRGGEQQRVEVEAAAAAEPVEHLDLLALDEALTQFAQVDAAKADLVKLRFFAGLTMAEAAEALGISLATAERHWTSNSLAQLRTSTALIAFCDDLIWLTRSPLA